MSPEAQRIAIAESLGYTCTGTDANGERVWTLDNWTWFTVDGLPDYLNDLNAMRVVEATLQTETFERADYLVELQCYDDHWRAVHATAAQKVEAYLKAKKLWRP